MNKYNVDDAVYFINKKECRIDYGVIQKIIIERDKICYIIELKFYSNIYTIEENLISKSVDELYQRIKDSVKKIFPLMLGQKL